MVVALVDGGSFPRKLLTFRVYNGLVLLSCLNVDGNRGMANGFQIAHNMQKVLVSEHLLADLHVCPKS